MNKKLIFLITSIITFVLSITFSFNNRIFFVLLTLLGIIVYKLFGFTKDNFRYKKDIFVKIITYLLFYYLLTYLSGLFFGFVKTGYSTVIITMIRNVLPLLLMILLSEIIRYMLIEKNRKSIIALLLITVLFCLIDINFNLYKYTFRNSYDVLEFILVVALPVIFKGALLTYLCFNIGYKTTIAYRVLYESVIYFVPFVPNFGLYLGTVVNIIVPSIVALLVYLNYQKVKRKKIDSRNFGRKSIAFYVVFALVLIMIVCLSSGVFKYYALTIGSGSMTGSINKGDVIIVKKLNDNEKKNIKKGEVLVFRYDEKIVVHRVIDIKDSENQKVFYTKGDYNESEDGYPIYYKDIIGITSIRIPYIGYPTVWLSEALK